MYQRPPPPQQPNPEKTAKYQSKLELGSGREGKGFYLSSKKTHVSGYDVEMVKMNEILPLHFPPLKCLVSVTDVIVEHNKTCLCAHIRNSKGCQDLEQGVNQFQTRVIIFLKKIITLNTDVFRFRPCTKKITLAYSNPTYLFCLFV